MDIYSNVLYAKESSPALSYLAQKVIWIAKYRPESCYIVGNYCSLKGYNEKAVVYFQRALKLDKNFLAAWTLMGHEYVEMNKTPAAIYAYRHAVDKNPCDYRAWYGLGQAYEITGMLDFALHYYKEAVFLQPKDSRMWIAMAQCYEKLHKVEDAIKCYKRAVDCDDREAIALHQLAKLYCEIGEIEEAAYYYKKDLERMESDEREGTNMVEALTFLAKHCNNEKRFEEAEDYCMRLLEYTGPEKETAKSLLRAIRHAKDVEHFVPYDSSF